MWMWGLGIPMYLAMPGSAHLLQVCHCFRLIFYPCLYI